MNTRSYPRTLNEAFPHTADYACAVERPREIDWQDRVVLWACIVAFVVCLAVVLS
jgi:hypothetical protein